MAGCSAGALAGCSAGALAGCSAGFFDAAGADERFGGFGGEGVAGAGVEASATAPCDLASNERAASYAHAASPAPTATDCHGMPPLASLAPDAKPLTDDVVATTRRLANPPQREAASLAPTRIALAARRILRARPLVRRRGVPSTHLPHELLLLVPMASGRKCLVPQVRVFYDISTGAFALPSPLAAPLVFSNASYDAARRIFSSS